VKKRPGGRWDNILTSTIIPFVLETKPVLGSVYKNFGSLRLLSLLYRGESGG